MRTRLQVLAMLSTVALLVTFTTRAQESGLPLASRLPADTTIVYCGVDLERGLDISERMLRFVDAEAGGKVAYEVSNLYGMIREMFSNYGFEPALLDRIGETKAYLVMMRKSEPVTTTTMQQRPVFDEDFMPVPGETEEYPVTKTRYFTLSLLIAAPDEGLAAGLHEAVTAVMRQQAERNPDVRELQRSDLDVPQGTLVQYGDGAFTLGQIGSYVVWSAGEPEELWQALMAPQAQTVATEPAHQRLQQGTGPRPQFLGMLNARALLDMAEEQLQVSVQQAQEAVAAGEGSDDPWANPQIRLQQAMMAAQAYQTAKQMFSLDKIGWLAASATAEVGDRVASSESRVVMSHGAPISQVLAEILDGAGTFQPPPVREEDALCLMQRVDAKAVYDAVVQHLQASPGQAMMQFQMAMQMMKMQVGVDLSDVFGMLAPDRYFFVRYVERDMSKLLGAGAPAQPEQSGMVMPMPQVTVLLGLRDATGATSVLDTVFTRLSTNPQASSWVKKRSYQGSDVYCLGSGVTQADAYPDGLTSFALAVAGRHLTLGSWDKVTDVLRRIKAESGGVDADLMRIVQQHPEANLLVVVPGEFQEHMRELSGRHRKRMSQMMPLAGGSMYRFVAEQILEGLPIEEPQMKERMQTSLAELMDALETVQDSIVHMLPDYTVMTGTHRGNFYEIYSPSEMRK